MAKWEYRVCAIEGGEPGRVEEQMNTRLRALSEQGWRFVETIYAQHSLPLLLFKKPVKPAGKFGLEKPSAV